MAVSYSAEFEYSTQFTFKRLTFRFCAEEEEEAGVTLKKLSKRPWVDPDLDFNNFLHPFLILSSLSGWMNEGEWWSENGWGSIKVKMDDGLSEDG